jgi:hypothetical protein
MTTCLHFAGIMLGRFQKTDNHSLQEQGGGKADLSASCLLYSSVSAVSAYRSVAPPHGNLSTDIHLMQTQTVCSSAICPHCNTKFFVSILLTPDLLYLLMSTLTLLFSFTSSLYRSLVVYSSQPLLNVSSFM